jgi:DNA helicase II / ATP-dependent DNA helicase PcrA
LPFALKTGAQFEPFTHFSVHTRKTRVLTVKIAKLLLEEIQIPQGVACLTYTRVMAKEIEQRLYGLGIQDRPNVFTGTVHSYCLSQIVSPYAQLFGVDIVDPIRIAPREIQNTCLSESIKKTLGWIPYDNYRWVKNQVSILRKQNADIPFEEWEEHQDISDVVRYYEEALAGQGFVDFDIIIKIGLKLLIDHSFIRNSLYAKFPWMAVDEYQDLGYPLNRIVTEMLNKTPTELFAIGDPNQSIFDFAGTDPKYLIELVARDDIKPAIKLGRNYRSKQEIIHVGEAILSKSTENYSEASGGKCYLVECSNFEQQIAEITEIVPELLKEFPPHEIAILHRWRTNLHQIARTLDENINNINIDYVLDKHELYDRTVGIIKWLEDMAYWCLEGWRKESSGRDSFDDILSFWFELGADRVLGFENDDNNARIHLTQTLWEFRNPQKLLSEWLDEIREKLFLDSLLEGYSELYPDDVIEFEKLSALAHNSQELSLLEIQVFANLNPSVQLTTLHSSKGTEFDVVVISGVEQIGYGENDIRLLYVGATRAKVKLFLLFSPNNKGELPNRVCTEKCVNGSNWAPVFKANGKLVED